MAVSKEREFTRSNTPSWMDEDAPTGFLVTCVVGSVTLSETGEMTPFEAALQLIGRHGAPGNYRFELPGGPTFEVNIAVDGEVNR